MHSKYKVSVPVYDYYIQIMISDLNRTITSGEKMMTKYLKIQHVKNRHTHL